MTGRVLPIVASLLALALAGCTTQSDAEADAAAGGDSVGDDVLAQLRALYVDNPMKGGQATPAHQFLDQGDGRFLFLHWNNPDASKATGLAFVGDAFRARGCVGDGGVTQAQIDAGYVHFHKQSAANWDQGHHADSDPDTMGYWFRHIAAAPGVDPMNVGAVPTGEVYPLMPSHENAPSCG